MVVIDSLTGYFHAMQDQQMLVTQMREMLTYMSDRGVLSLFVEAQHGLVGRPSQNRLDISYIADTAVLLRNFEAGGAVRRAISVIKKRYGDHEKRIRERLGLFGGRIQIESAPGKGTRVTIGVPLQVE